jgi:hypothetical protein
MSKSVSQQANSTAKRIYVFSAHFPSTDIDTQQQEGLAFQNAREELAFLLWQAQTSHVQKQIYTDYPAAGIRASWF